MRIRVQVPMRWLVSVGQDGDRLTRFCRLRKTLLVSELVEGNKT